MPKHVFYDKQIRKFTNKKLLTKIISKLENKLEILTTVVRSLVNFACKLGFLLISKYIEKSHKIPKWLFERVFSNFSSSRNI